MCGIAGFTGNKSKSQLEEMTSILRHRGPDASGYYHETSSVGLGHRRLSIIDLSQSANQPFKSRDGRYIMVYNGEVYNFQTLAKTYNIETHTSSDTEVILELYSKLGTRSFEHLNGMFALAIWDTLEKSLLVARDRLGIKPLYINMEGGELSFASEIKGLLKIVKPELNEQAIANYLYLGYLPQGFSLYKNIKQFPAGSFGFFKNGRLQVSPYWKAENQIKKIPLQISNINEAKEGLNDLLRSSVQKRMISDVPLGTFLSGGIDSSTVTAIAQSISERPVKTFSIGFKESKFNESAYAKKVAKHLNTDHYEFMLSERDAIDKIESLLDIYDEPFVDSSSISTLLVSEMAKKHVTVALSGDGGDELFLGYGMYNWAKRLNSPLINSSRRLIASGLSMGNNRMKRASYLFKWTDSSKIKSHIFSQEQYLFSESEISALLSTSITSKIQVEEQYTHDRMLDAQEQQAFFDIKNYLKDDLLVKVDRASMHHSLEVRVPILDHRIVEFALNLPKHWKLKNKASKFLLKSVLFDYLPSTLFDRPKWGFGVPLITWLQKDLRYLIEDHLNEKTIKECNLVNWNVVSQLKKLFFAGESYLYNRLWALLMLHMWYKKIKY